MKLVRLAPIALLASSLPVLLAIASCSKGGGGYGSPTSPTGGGGGGLVLNSGSLAQGQMYAHTFSTAGRFPYHCSIHASMRDTIIVDSTAVATSAAVSISGFQFTPKNTHVKPGSTVTWTQNDSGTNHTVTSD